MTTYGYPNQKGMSICVPFTGRGLHYRIMLAYSQLMPPMNYNTRYLHTGPNPFQPAPPIDVARNWFADQSLAAGCRYMFFMDEDVVVPQFAVRQLLHRLEHHPDAAIAAGIYCQKAQPPEPMVFRGSGDGPYWDWKAGELFECDSIGMGCAMIRLDALKDIEKPWFKTVNDNDAFLDNKPLCEGWTEDIWFCDRVRKAGFKILADGAILPDHVNLETGEAWNLPPGSKPVAHLEVKKGTKKILDLGCGESPYQTDEGEVITCDVRGEVNPTYRCDLRRLPFDADQFDVVFSSHTLEHFARDEVDSVLDEWLRVLKPKGELRLVIPNIEWAADRIKQGIIDNDVLNVLYGAQGYSENFHKVGFTPTILQTMLKKRGYKSDVKLDGYNIILRATKNGMVGRTQRKRGVSRKNR